MGAEGSLSSLLSAILKFVAFENFGHVTLRARHAFTSPEWSRHMWLLFIYTRNTIFAGTREARVKPLSFFFSSAKIWEKRPFSKCYTISSPGQTDSQVDTSLIGLAFNLRFVWPPTCVDLRRLAWICVGFGWAQIWTQEDASFLSFWPPSASRCKLIASNLLL